MKRLLNLLVDRFNNHTLRVKLIITFIVVSVLSIAIVAVSSSFITRQALIREANQRLLAAANQTSSNLNNFVQTNLNAIRTEAQTPVLAEYLQLSPEQRPGSPQEAEVIELLSALSRKDPTFISSYALIDKIGIDVADTFPADINRVKLTEDYFQTPLETGLPYVSPVRFSESVKQFSIYFSSPVRDGDDHIIGVLRVRYNAGVLQQLVGQSNNLAGDRSFAILLDEYGIRLADGFKPDLILTSIVPLEIGLLANLRQAGRLPLGPVADASTNLPDLAQGIAQANSGGDQNFIATPHPGAELGQAAVVQLKPQSISTFTWTVMFVQPRSAFLAPVVTQTPVTIVLTVLIAILMAVVAFGVSQFLSQPIVQLTGVARQITAGDLAVRAPESAKDETGQLAAAFNAMTDQLRELISTLEVRVRERTQALETAADISLRLATILDVDEALQYVIDRLQTEYDFYHTHVYLLDQKSDMLVMTKGYGKVGQMLKEQGHSLEMGQGIVGTVASTNQPFVSNDVNQVLNFVRNRYLPNTNSELAVPLRKGDRVLGVLDIQSQHLNRFAPEDVSLIQSIANQIAAVVDNARLLEEMQLTLQAVERLNRRITRESWGETITEIEVPGYRFQRKRGEVGPDRDTWLAPMKQAAAQRQLVKQTYPGNGQPLQTELAVPLMLRGEIIGVLGVKREETPDWAEEEVSAVEAVANQVALALENARLAKEQEKTIEKLKEVDRIKSEFLTSMSHELRTPLNSIIGFADVLLQGIDGELNEMAINDIQLIYNSGQHLLALINDILDISKIEAGMMELVREPLDLKLVVKDVLAATGSLLKDKPVKMVVDLPDELSEVYADRLRLNQILLNLASNAAKFTDEGTITIKARLAEDDPAMMFISVTDTGIGIPVAKLEAVFDRFSQVDAGTTRKYGGTGLGLPICRQLVQLHGGAIGVTSQPGEGSTFYFTIPLAESIVTGA